MPLTLTPLTDIPLIRHGDNLADIVVNALPQNNITVNDGDIFVLAQKIVSKAEGRTVHLSTVTPSQRAQEIAAQAEKDPRVVELILQESNEVLRTRVGAIIVEHKLGFVCANAGIDHSNVNPPLPLGEGLGVRAKSPRCGAPWQTASRKHGRPSRISISLEKSMPLDWFLGVKRYKRTLPKKLLIPIYLSN